MEMKQPHNLVSKRSSLSKFEKKTIFFRLSVGDRKNKKADDDFLRELYFDSDSEDEFLGITAADLEESRVRRQRRALEHVASDGDGGGDDSSVH
mgnify:FL=1